MSTATTRPSGPTASASTAVMSPCPQPTSSTEAPAGMPRPVTSAAR